MTDIIIATIHPVLKDLIVIDTKDSHEAGDMTDMMIKWI
jgi:hypothetical protein